MLEDYLTPEPATQAASRAAARKCGKRSGKAASWRRVGPCRAASGFAQGPAGRGSLGQPVQGAPIDQGAGAEGVRGRPGRSPHPVAMATHRPRRMRRTTRRFAGSAEALRFNGHSSAKAHAPSVAGPGAQGRRSSCPSFNGHSSAKAHAPEPWEGAVWSRNLPNYCFNGHSSAKAHAPDGAHRRGGQRRAVVIVSMATHRPRRMRPVLRLGVVLGELPRFNGHSSAKAHAPLPRRGGKD